LEEVKKNKTPSQLKIWIGKILTKIKMFKSRNKIIIGPILIQISSKLIINLKMSKKGFRNIFKIYKLMMRNSVSEMKRRIRIKTVVIKIIPTKKFLKKM